MFDLKEMTRPLIDQTLVTRPDVAVLRRRNQRRSRRRLSVVSTVLVAAVASTFALTQMTGSGGSPQVTRGAQPTSYFQASINIPDSTLSTVGVPDSLVVPTMVAPGTVTASTNHVVSYVGAENCPYCAIQRWALLIALSKFGNFENLSNAVYSSSSDVFPHLASWSFVGSQYSSPYFTFDPTEIASSIPNGNGGYQPLEMMNAGQKTSYDLYDSQGSLPFIDMGNGVVTVGASSSPSVLEGLTLSQIGSDIQVPTSPVAKAVDGTANYLIAALCSMVTGSQPHICNSPTIALARGNINLGHAPNGATSDLAPTQPATNAPLAIWRQWSDAMHAYLLRTLPLIKAQHSRGCVTLAADVNATVYTKTNLGIPPGIKVWAVSLSGHCNSDATSSKGN